MAVNEIVRVVLTPKGADADSAADRQIVLDMKIDPDTQLSTGPYPAFGRIGDFRKPETLYPFALMFDGRLDFGAYATDGQPVHKIDIRAAKIAVGQEVAYHMGDDSAPYGIDMVTALLA